MIGPLAVCFTVKPVIVAVWLRVACQGVCCLASHRLSRYMRLEIISRQLLNYSSDQAENKINKVQFHHSYSTIINCDQ